MRGTKWELIWIVVGMVFLPLTAVYLVPGDGGMAVMLLLFFAVNPLFSVCMGIRAGRDVKKRWYLPFATAFVFLMAAWLLFSLWEIGFVLYAGIYLVLGYIAMGISAMICRK